MRSSETAVRIHQYIAQNAGKRKKQITAALAITPDQFQNAVPYITRHCERILCKWYVNKRKGSPNE